MYKDTDLQNCDFIVFRGFSYGDYLRSGARKLLSNYEKGC